MKINTKNILQNKFVLYLVFFLSLVSVFGYITTSNFQAVLLFVLISLLTNYFSKNMIVILGAAIIGTNLVTLMNGSFILNNSNNVVEGFNRGMKMSEGDNPEEDNKDADEDADEGDTKKEEFATQPLTPAAIDNIPNIDNLTNLLSKSDKGKKTEKAYKIVNLALQTYPDDLELNNELAILCEQSQKWEEAEKALEKVIKLSGDNVQELLPIRLARATRRKALKEGPTRKNVESVK